MVIYSKKDFRIGMTSLALATALILWAVFYHQVRPLTVFLIGILLLIAWVELNAGLDREMANNDGEEEESGNPSEGVLMYRLLQAVLAVGMTVTLLLGMISDFPILLAVSGFFFLALVVSALAELIGKTMKKSGNRTTSVMKEHV